MAPHIFNIAKNQHMELLAEYQANRDVIATTTIGQRLNRKWRDMNKKFLTSFYFSFIVNAKNRKSYQKLLANILYQNVEFSDSAENRHNGIHEQKALHDFGLLYGSDSISKCGLIIDAEKSYLATYPFRFFGDNAVIIIKCPLKAYNERSVEEAINKSLTPLWKFVSGVEIINKASAWYIEIQGQLHITRKSFAYVVVWIRSEFRIEKVLRDDDFWETKMKEPLTYFWEQVMIKELVNPRKRRSMPLRAYNPSTEIFE